MADQMRAAAEQALEALEYMHDEKCDYMRRNNLGDPLREDAARLALPAISALRAALAQAEPDHETRAELAEQQVVQLAEERDHYRNLWQKAQQAEPVRRAERPAPCARHCEATAFKIQIRRLQSELAGEQAERDALLDAAKFARTYLSLYGETAKQALEIVDAAIAKAQGGGNG